MASRWYRWFAGGLLAASAASSAQERMPGEVVVIVDPPETAVAPSTPPEEEDDPPRPLPARGRFSYENPKLDRLASPTLERFASDRDFANYLRAVRAATRRTAALPGDEIVVAQTTVECTDPELCPEEESSDANVVVTGTKAAAPSITNNQSAGVDEGDIVKRIGDYLLVLQDGRVFAIHFPTMRLTDRVDVFRRDKDGEPTGADWYDEMLVQDDQVLVTAYSYGDSASEITVFKLDKATGRLTKRGVFLISSDDYYDIDNYATRIVGDKLVVYTPYEATELEGRGDRPVVRRWQPGETWESAVAAGRRLLDARDVFRPVAAVDDPWVHTVSICPLADLDRRGLDCASTAFVAGPQAEMYVSPKTVFLWTGFASDDDRSWHDCPLGVERAKAKDVAPGAVFRLPITGGEPSVLGVRGMVFDQFSMDQFDGRFRALANWAPQQCDAWQSAAQVALLNVSESAFGPTYEPAGDRLMRPAPAPPSRSIENRFAGDWLVYGGRGWYGRYPPREAPAVAAASRNALVAVPLRKPDATRLVPIGHTVVRLERVGDDVIASGYRDPTGLRLSMIDLADSARVASTAHLVGRFESESRSHAFNSMTRADGSGLMGVPTVLRADDSGGWWWRSNDSDLSFLSFDPADRLADGGVIKGPVKPEEGPDSEEPTGTAPGYECEVSCIDWYGNARPIFIGEQVFGLLGTELVEARLEGGRVAPQRRLDLTGPVAR